MAEEAVSAVGAGPDVNKAVNNSLLWRRPCSAVAWSGSEHSHIRLLLLFVLCGLTAFIA